MCRNMLEELDQNIFSQHLKFRGYNNKRNRQNPTAAGETFKKNDDLKSISESTLIIHINHHHLIKPYYYTAYFLHKTC